MRTQEKLITLLKESVEKCYQNDKPLIDKSMEQASVARIFYYMQDALCNDKRFKDLSQYNLDSEYNKNGEQIKATPRRTRGTRPDIVLHKRGNNHNNLMVVEFKSATNYKHSNDYIKLEDFTKSDIYNYSLGVYVKLNKRNAKFIFFQHGNEKKEQEL